MRYAHDLGGPQPEACELCGTIQPVSELRSVEVDGLRTALVCSTTRSCRGYQATRPFIQGQDFELEPFELQQHTASLFDE